MRSPDLFDNVQPRLDDPTEQHVPPAERVLAHAIVLLGNPARGCTQAQLKAEGARMREAGIHGFKLGEGSNLRNRIQRNCAQYKIWRTHWRAKGYAAIFERVSAPREEPLRIRVVDWYAEQLRAELVHGK